MSPKSKERSRGARLTWRALFAIVFAAGLSLRGFTAWSALERRPFSGVPDDTFYYFAIARNPARGLPPSIDGVNPTNGFHPLWMLVLVALFRVGGWAPGALAPL